MNLDQYFLRGGQFLEKNTPCGYVLELHVFLTQRTFLLPISLAPEMDQFDVLEFQCDSKAQGNEAKEILNNHL